MAIVTITSDFTGKIKGSLAENRNIGRLTYNGLSGNNDSSPNILLPNQMGEIDTQAKYDYLGIKGSWTISSVGDDNTRGQMIYSFDIIWAIEKIYGQTLWRGKTAIEDKIRIAKEIVQNVKATVRGYGMNKYNGSNVWVYKMYVSALTDANVWDAPIVDTHTTLYDVSQTIDLDGYIDASGYIHITAYSDIDTLIDATAQANVYIDYANIDITLDNDDKPYTDVEVWIPRNRWIGFYLTESVRQELVDRYNQVGKVQEVHTQKPLVTIRTYKE